MKSLAMRCRCGWLEHQYHLTDLSDPGDRPETRNFALSVHLRPLPFWARVQLAIRYIGGHRSRYGAFDEMVVGEREAHRIHNWIDEWLAR